MLVKGGLFLSNQVLVFVNRTGGNFALRMHAPADAWQCDRRRQRLFNIFIPKKCSVRKTLYKAKSVSSHKIDFEPAGFFGLSQRARKCVYALRLEEQLSAFGKVEKHCSTQVLFIIYQIN